MPVCPVVSRWWASSAPTSSPRSIRQPWASGTAAAQRSASGSLATTRSTSRCDGQGEREVHRARLLGVGERHRRELRVGLLLLGHDVRRVEAGRLEHLHDRGAADAVQRRVDQLEVAGPVAEEAGDGVQVASRRSRHRARCRRGRGARRRARRRRRCGARSRHRQAARSGCRRRGRPCSRCRGAGCGWRSPSPRPRSRARGSRTPAGGWAAAAAARAPADPHPSSPRRCRGRRRRSCAGRRSRSRRRHRGRPPGRGGTPRARPPRG